jgi:hypothetical protein
MISLKVKTLFSFNQRHAADLPVIAFCARTRYIEPPLHSKAGIEALQSPNCSFRKVSTWLCFKSRIGCVRAKNQVALISTS